MVVVKRWVLRQSIITEYVTCKTSATTTTPHTMKLLKCNLHGRMSSSHSCTPEARKKVKQELMLEMNYYISMTNLKWLHGSVIIHNFIHSIIYSMIYCTHPINNLWQLLRHRSLTFSTNSNFFFSCISCSFSTYFIEAW